MTAILGAVLTCIGGYLIGAQRERDRSKHKAAAAPLTQQPDADWAVSDREWERFVCAIYDLADRETPREG